jgi:Flp pilus assembly protein CpaB
MMAISSDGKTLFVAIRDENKLGIVSTADLRAGFTSPGDTVDIIKVDTGGETHGVAYRDGGGDDRGFFQKLLERFKS